MLKKLYRLTGNVNLRNTKALTTPFFTLRVSKNGLSYNRFGFIISKKVDKRAVYRNRSKRVLRNCIETNLEEIEKGNDFLFIIRKNIESSLEICPLVKEIFLKEGLTK